MMAAAKDFVIEQGKTFSQVLRWEAPPIIYKPITAITKTAPVRITSANHGIPNGWRVAVVSVKGMTEINAGNNPPKDKDYNTATVVDVNTVELNTVNSADFKPYISGGYLQFNTPVDLTGYTARMSIKDKVGGTLLFQLLSSPGLTDGAITLNTTDYSISLTVSATISASLTWKKGVYDLELVSSTGVVTALLSGVVTVSKEVTTA
jgi:hypothetical protein